MENIIEIGSICGFEGWLRERGRGKGTVEKYARDVRGFARWLAGREASAERAAEWREELVEKGYAAVTVNSMTAALNAYFKWRGWTEARVKPLRIQKSASRDSSKELTREEYQRLVEAAPERLKLVMETICGTGIRVSELRFITVEAVRAGEARVRLKGKIRTILLPGKLCKKLLKYIKSKKIKSGEVFLTGRGKPISRRQIWAEMKKLAAKASVDASKIFPHNLRHLFARCFFRVCRDIVKLADVLGHSSVETTRIYLITTGEEHRRTLDQLCLVS